MKELERLKQACTDYLTGEAMEETNRPMDDETLCECLDSFSASAIDEDLHAFAKLITNAR